MNGKSIRCNRIIKNGKMLCVPIDHGITNADIVNLTNFKTLSESLISNGATALVVHKGMVRFLPDLRQTGLIIHISVSTEKQQEVNKKIACDVLEAVQLGADAISIHVNIGNQYEKEMLADLGFISNECQKHGMPLMVMIYIRDDENNDISTPAYTKHAIRIATELGADIVKIAFNRDVKELKEIVEESLVPIVIAGGEYNENVDEFYKRVEDLMTTGILGISIGRKVFKSKNPDETMKKLYNIVYNKVR